MNSNLTRTLVIILGLSIFSVSSCNYSEPDHQPEKSEADKLYGYWIIYSLIKCGRSRWEEVSATVTDNHDGTITYVQTTRSGNHDPICFTEQDKTTTETVHYKKCLQGQVYREAEDDCKGTGTSGDYYGAQKFQFCPTAG